MAVAPDLLWQLADKGFSPLPIRGRDKKPKISWKIFQARPPSKEEVEAWPEGDMVGLAFRDGLEAIDFDVPGKHSEGFEPSAAPMFEPWKDLLLDNGLLELLGRLAIYRTPSGGHQVIYRCEGLAEGNAKLAYDPAISSEALIETRGFGGYSVIPPSKGYEWVQGDLSSIPVIDRQDRDALLNLARILDQRVPVIDPVPDSETPPSVMGLKPGEDFAARTSWEEILEPHGWTKAPGVGQYAGQTLWVRPGKLARQGHSAKTGDNGKGDYFFCWSGNAGVPAEKALGKFALKAHLDYGGDYKAAARALAKQGYGSTVRTPLSVVEGGIVVNNRQLVDVSNDALAALAKANTPPTLFIRSGELVHIKRDENGSPVVSPSSANFVRSKLSQVANWWKITKDGQQDVFPPLDVANDLLARADWQNFPRLVSVTSCPIVAPNGSVRLAEGYDPATGFYLAEGTDPEDEWKGPPEEAMRFLTDDLLGDFPFASDSDRANALALMFLPFLRTAFEGPTPLHLADAPVQGTGKSLLIEVLLTPSVGGKIYKIGGDGNDEEWRKVITTALMQGRSHVFFDNLDKTVDSAALARVLTSSTWSDRILGTNTAYDGLVRCAWAATTNNAKMSRDIARRTVWIRLDAGVERPEERGGFKHPDILGWAQENRGIIIAAIVAVIRGWVAKKMPRSEARFGSFEAYAGVIGGVLESAGIQGFLGNIEELRASVSPEEGIWKEFVREWWAEFADAPVLTKDLMPTTERVEGFADLLTADNDAGKRRQLGRMIAKRIGQVFGGHRLTAAGMFRAATRVKLSPVGPEKLSQTAKTITKLSPQNGENQVQSDSFDSFDSFFDDPTRAGAHDTRTYTRERAGADTGADAGAGAHVRGGEKNYQNYQNYHSEPNPETGSSDFEPEGSDSFGAGKLSPELSPDEPEPWPTEGWE